MIRRPGSLGRLLIGAALLLAGARAFGQTPGQTSSGDDLDDPKLARRLKTRVAMPLPGASPRNSAPPPAPSDTLAVMPSQPVDVSAPVSPLPSSSPSAASSREPAPAGVIIASSREPPARSERTSPSTPTLELAYRRFSFVRLGAVDSGSANGKSASEPFDSLSLDFYPMSRLVRFGISSQYGWQSGAFNNGSGDYFIAETFSLGLQRPGPTVTPFAQGLAGAGYMRRFQFARTVPTAYWQLGVDAGVDVAVARHAFFSAAIGYLHPVNGYAKEQSFATIFVDTWSFKLGIGI